MSEHNFIRGNTIETMKLLKTMRAKEEPFKAEAKPLTSPLFRKHAQSLYQPSVSTLAESKTLLLSDNSNNKYQHIEDNMNDNSTSFLTNQQNLSSFLLEEEKRSILDESTLSKNNTTQVENILSLKSISKTRFTTPNRYFGNKKQNNSPCQLSHSPIQKIPNGISNQLEKDSFEEAQFIYKIKNKRFPIKHQDNQKNKVIKQKEVCEQVTLENQIHEQICSSPYIQNSIATAASQNSNPKNCENLNGSNYLLAVSDFQYMLESNFKTITKRGSNEQEQLLNQNPSLNINQNSFNNINNYDWKQKLIKTINQKANESQQTYPLCKVQQNTLSPIKIFDYKCRTEAISKRSSKEVQLGNSIQLQPCKENDEFITSVVEGCNSAKRILSDKPTLQEIILDNTTEIRPHEKRQQQNIFKDKFSFLEVLKNFSENFKKVEKRCASSQPKSNTNNLQLDNNQYTARYSSKNIVKNNYPQKSDNPFEISNNGQMFTPQNQKQIENLLNTTLQPKESQLARGQFNSNLYYSRLSSLRKNKSRDNSRRAQDYRQNEQILSQQIQEQLYKDQLNKSQQNNNNSPIDIDKQQKFITKNSIQFKRIMQIQELSQKEMVTSSINSIDLEPVQQPEMNNSNNPLLKQNQINTFYTNYNQRKKNTTPLKNQTTSPSKNIYSNNKDITPRIQTTSPQKNQIINNNSKLSNKKQISYSFAIPKLFSSNQPQIQLNRKTNSNNLLQISDNDLLPWELSKRNSQMNDIDIYMNLHNKTGLIQG